MFLLYCRKELKDPDQLYSTLKTILQHVKVNDRHTHTHADVENLHTHNFYYSYQVFLDATEPPERLAVHGASEENGGPRLLPGHPLPNGCVHEHEHGSVLTA